MIQVQRKKISGAARLAFRAGSWAAPILLLALAAAWGRGYGLERSMHGGIALGDGTPAPVLEKKAASFLKDWAELAEPGLDSTTGFPKRIRRTKDGGMMALVPGGTFQMGCVPGDEGSMEDDKPRHSVTLFVAYYLDVTEVTNAQFLKFVEASRHKTTAEKDGNGGMLMLNGTFSDEAAGATWRAPLPGGKRPVNWESHLRRPPATALRGYDSADAQPQCPSLASCLPSRSSIGTAVRTHEALNPRPDE